MLPYGLESYRDLFTSRQLLVASLLCAATRDAHGAMIASRYRLNSSTSCHDIHWTHHQQDRGLQLVVLLMGHNA